MAKRQITYYDQNLINALKKLPNPIIDEEHNLLIYLDDNRARSNQSRFEHIVGYRHELTIKDIESIPEGIKTPFKYRKDKIRKRTYNYYLKRRGELKGLIKVSIVIDNKNERKAKIKTIFITRIVK